MEGTVKIGRSERSQLWPVSSRAQHRCHRAACVNSDSTRGVVDTTRSLPLSATPWTARGAPPAAGPATRSDLGPPDRAGDGGKPRE